MISVSAAIASCAVLCGGPDKTACEEPTGSVGDMLELPEEILESILSYLYPPWHLVIKRRVKEADATSFDDYLADPPLPLAPLLASTITYRISKKLLTDAFTGDVDAQDDLVTQYLPPRLNFLRDRVRYLFIPYRYPAFDAVKRFVADLQNLETVEIFRDDLLVTLYGPCKHRSEVSLEECKQEMMEKIGSETFSQGLNLGLGDVFQDRFAIEEREWIVEHGLTILRHKRVTARSHPDCIYDMIYQLTISENSRWKVVDKTWRTASFNVKQRIADRETMGIPLDT